MALTGTGLIFFALSCMEIDPIFPQSRNYELSARGAEYSIDEYALIRKNETIQPFFVFPLKDDPDVAGITVSLRTSDGRQAGNNVRYVLEAAQIPEDSADKDLEEKSDIVLFLENLGGLFPPFSMPENIRIGPYLMVFTVYGRNNALIARNEKSIFYMAEDDYAISDINVFLPALSIPSHLIPAETVVLLEAGITADDSLDPYIFWYNGRTIIGEGRFYDGANRLLWTVPFETGFQNIRAEVIPFPPLRTTGYTASMSLRPDRIHRGRSRELLLPVAAGGDFNRSLSGRGISGLLDSMKTADQGNIILDFQLKGELIDSQNPFSTNSLVRRAAGDNGINRQPHWYPVGEVYGLQIGPEDIYELPFILREDNTEKQTTFILRFISVNEGVHFGFSFDSETMITLSRESDLFILIFNSGEREYRIPIDIDFEDEFITLILDFIYQNDYLTISINENGINRLLMESGISLPFSPGTQGTLQLGGQDSFGEIIMILGGLSVISF